VELRDRFGFDAAAVGVLGGSHGAAVALTVLAERPMPIHAAVLVSPLVQLRPIVKAAGEHYGMTYAWSEASEAVADQIDFVARAAEVGRDEPAVRLVVGANDHVDAVQGPAATLRDALADRYAKADRVDLVTIEGMEHALAEEPGLEPAPQLPHAAEVDRHAVRWFQEHLQRPAIG
jgi:alpha-beta hydrolase superfamily lysophospholipase